MATAKATNTTGMTGEAKPGDWPPPQQGTAKAGVREGVWLGASGACPRRTCPVDTEIQLPGLPPSNAHILGGPPLPTHLSPSWDCPAPAPLTGHTLYLIEGRLPQPVFPQQ